MEIKMDIENMHPFCLPFSLCHESASGLADSKDSKIAGDREKYCSGNNNNSTSVNNNNNNNFERTRSRLKGALSPLEDLFDSSNLSPPLSSRSVFQEECLIESSVFAGNSSSFHALHLDLDMDIDSVREGASPHLGNFEHDDWFANSNPSPHDCLVFSPTGSITNSAATTTRASKSHSSIEHNDSQVFHIVDPIAIKSSPTLAQLNLNSNDDPTDALWGDGASSRAASCVAAGAMITNSTSILSANLHSNPDLHPTCTHLHNSCLGDHYSLCNQQQHTHLASDYSTHSGGSHSPMCHHLYHNNHHHQLEHVGGQSTCLAVAPFTKKQELYRPDLIANNVGFCVYQQQTIAPLSNQVQQQQRHINCQCPARAGETGTIGNGHSKADCQQSTQVSRVQQPRSVSPAPLVTSSSSPLSSSGAQRAPSDRRISENKLKENIEYLTVLLSNGSNKLEKPQQNQQQQSPTISSTIVKSYTTLAQSLSTEPKLLLQSSNAQLHNNNYYQTSSAPNTHQQNSLTVNDNGRPWLSTNEANQLNQHQLQHQQQWFKSSPVESSISAADSTAENNQISTTQSPMCNSNFSPSQNNTSVMDPTLTSRPAEMKVLSSLLSSNMGRLAPMGELGPLMSGPQICANWHGGNSQPSVQSIAQPMSHMQAHSPVIGAYPMSHQSASLQQANSIPPTGRPITLTPLLSNNVMIGQRQSPQRQSPKPKASKVPTFAQPASPSASSTTSSSGNTEIASSASSSSLAASAAPSKRQKASAPLAKASDRFGRPSSLSTECSLSSHDEGFSSQVDQDDCMNSIRDDSEDDSDVDSDDESFYGDYTNNDLIGASISDNPDCKWALSMGRTRRNGQRRFFWQYNVQSKGPKGARIASADGSENPFVLPEASDPVFSNDCQIEGVKHSGKARRGDGNDLTPNPRKLLMIGLELKKLSKIINELAPVTDLPVNARNKTRKEKNKLASRACRLKKKAQHEANKIKLFGLQHEHQQVVMAIHNVRKVLRESLADSSHSSQRNPMKSRVKDIFDQCSTSVAGKTSDYVNSVLEKVVSGFIDGGLQS